MNLIWLALSTVTTWFVASVVLFFVSDRPPWLASSVAMVICLLPAMGTLAIVGRMERRSAVEAIGAVLVAPLIRLIAVSVLGAMAYAVCPGLRREPLDFLAWTCGFYLLTLVVETALLLPNKRSMAIPESTDSPQP